MGRENKMLLGVTNFGELAFGEFEVTTRNGYREFTASFNTCNIVDATNFDKEEYAEGMLDGLDKAYLYDLCDRNDCTPSELPKIVADQEDIMELIDCSLYSECYEVDEIEYVFQSSSCGQHDLREDGMLIYTNKTAFKLLMELWDEFHLKEITPEAEKKMEKVIELLSNIDEEKWIRNYIKKHYKESA